MESRVDAESTQKRQQEAAPPVSVDLRLDEMAYETAKVGVIHYHVYSTPDKNGK